MTNEIKNKTSGKHDIKIYSTPTCPWCIRVKSYLKDNKVEFKDYNVATDETAREEMMQKSGQIGVPVIDIDGTIIIGFDKHEIDHKLSLSH
ncbi:MAG: glutaredoxin domain-containing protein [archaeon]